MKLATTIGEMYPFTASPAEAVRAYEGTGFRYLDYSFYNAYKDGSPYVLVSDAAWKKEIEEVIKVSEELGFQFVQAHAPGFNPKGKDADCETGIRSILRSIEACGMLKIPNIVLHTSFSMDMLYPQDREAYFRYNRSFLEQLLPTAEKYGVTICVENSAEANMGERYFFMTPEEMNSFLEFVNHPNLGICWDIGHCLMRGRADQYQEFLELGKNLKAVHIHDNNGLSDQHLAPGLGKIDLDSVLRGLTEIHFPGPFTFEADKFFPKTPGNGPLAQRALAVKRDAVTMLYRIGKNALEAWSCFEEGTEHVL